MSYVLTCFGHLGKKNLKLKIKNLKNYVDFSINLKTRSATNMKRFKFYSLYAWLVSSIMTSSIVLANLVLDESHPLFLDIGKDKCSVDDVGNKYWGEK